MTSRLLPDIVQEAEQIAANGYKEIVITGVHLGAYGLDSGRQTTIADILEHIHPIDGIERIRFSSIEAMNFPPDLVDRMAALPKCMPHFHLPLQAGSDKILRQMRRRYTREQFLADSSKKLRDSFPNVGNHHRCHGRLSGRDRCTDFEDSLQFVRRDQFQSAARFPLLPSTRHPCSGAH